MIRRTLNRLLGRQVLRVGELLIVRPRWRRYRWKVSPDADYMGVADEQYATKLGEWYLRGSDE